MPDSYNIKVKLYAGLSEFLPPGAEENTTIVSVNDQTTVNKVIDDFKVPRDLAHLILLNGVYMKPEERDEVNFQDGDTLAIWPPVAGG